MPGAATVERRSLAELTRAVFGEELTMDEAWSALDELAVCGPRDRGDYSAGVDDASASGRDAELWIGSVGYELHKDHRAFAQLLSNAGIERLIDVRDLPISRRRGYAKTALSQALEDVGVEYLHAKALGNPKPIRDLFKSGRLEEGRELYREHLLGKHLEDLCELVELLGEKRSALMCVEHDATTCHRSVIVQALTDELGLRLDVAEVV